VFKEWAHSWAKRTVIQQAIRGLDPKPPCHADSSEDGTTSSGLRSVPNRQDAIDRLLSLDDFDRFVFLMSVLERYPEHDCALLLGCSSPDVRDARMRALQQITWGRPPRTEEDLVVDEVTSGVGGSHHA
jgi:DNA-directed RNA polymerase specialized sigma24 family protein